MSHSERPRPRPEGARDVILAGTQADQRDHLHARLLWLQLVIKMEECQRLFALWDTLRGDDAAGVRVDWD